MYENIALLSLKKVTREQRIINSRELLSFDEKVSNPSMDEKAHTEDAFRASAETEVTDKHQLSPPTDEHPATYEESKKEMREAIHGSNDLLINARTTLSLLRDEVTLDRAKLTIIRHDFIRSAEVMSIQIEDVMNVTASVGPLFGNITITSRVMNSGPFTIGKFWRSDAVKLKRIIHGYLIALKREIDCSTIPTVELRHMLDKLGEDEHQI